MYYRALLFLIFGLLMSMSCASYALGKLGHQLVCQLSYDLLTDIQQQRIDQLLLNLSPATIKLINKYNYQNLNNKIDFAKACTWADAIKSKSTFNRYKSWHYVNISRDQKTLNANNCQNDCLTSAIIFHSKLLAKSQKTQEKVQALMFLGHWLGDIHQPLHISFASDFGGNKIKIKPPFGKCKNLHWYWDQCLLYVEKPQKNITKFQYLYQQLSTTVNSVETPLWHETSVYEWANESIAIVRAKGVGYCENNKGLCLPLVDEKTELTLAYHQKYHTLLQQRIILAAHRLTSVLTEVL